VAHSHHRRVEGGEGTKGGSKGEVFEKIKRGREADNVRELSKKKGEGYLVGRALVKEGRIR